MKVNSSWRRTPSEEVYRSHTHQGSKPARSCSSQIPPKSHCVEIANDLQRVLVAHHEAHQARNAFFEQLCIRTTSLLPLLVACTTEHCHDREEHHLISRLPRILSMRQSRRRTRARVRDDSSMSSSRGRLGVLGDFFQPPRLTSHLSRA